MLAFSRPDDSIVSGIVTSSIEPQWSRIVLEHDSYTVEPFDKHQLRSMMKTHLGNKWPQETYTEPFRHYDKLIYTSEHSVW